MKYQIRKCLAVSMLFLLNGCGIGGHWMTGDPFYKPDIKPYLQYWEKEGMTEEGRRGDSIECGGPPNDSIQFGSNAIQAAQQPGETERETETRLRQDWVVCMRGKGYRDRRSIKEEGLIQ